MCFSNNFALKIQIIKKKIEKMEKSMKTLDLIKLKMSQFLKEARQINHQSLSNKEKLRREAIYLLFLIKKDKKLLQNASKLPNFLSIMDENASKRLKIIKKIT